MRLVLASRNADKLREPGERSPVGRSNAGVPEDPVEDGDTFLVNARIKARHGHEYARARDWVVGEDSGIEAAALGGRPGVESARWADDGVVRLLAELKGSEDRRARYVCVLVVLAPTARRCTRRARSKGRSRPSHGGARASGTTRLRPARGRSARSRSWATRGRPSTRIARRPPERSPSASRNAERW